MNVVATTRSLASVLVLASGVALASACDVGIESVFHTGIDAGGPVELAETTPGLIDGAGAVVFTFSTLESCRTLIDAPAATLEDLVDAEPNPTKQRIPMLRGKVDADRDGAFEDGTASHTFGTIPPNVPVSFLALAVTTDPGRNFELGDLEGTIFAVGCRAIVAAPGKRQAVPIVLAPAGLR
jgi:hypothetical protein